MPMSDAMSKALALHPPAEKMPEWKAKQPEVLAEAKRLNRNRASLNSDSYTVMANVWTKAFNIPSVQFDRTDPKKAQMVEEMLDTVYNLLARLATFGLKPGDIDTLFTEIHAAYMAEVKPDIAGLIRSFD